MSEHKLRRLGIMERYHATRHFVGMDACIVTSARYTTHEDTTLTKELLFPALRIVIEAHALLGVRFDSREDSLDISFLRLPSVDLTRVVQFSGHSDLQNAITNQLSRRFEDTQGDLPLWRLEVLADNTVILAMHHAIGDGLSTATFHRSLLQALQETPIPLSSYSVPVPEVRALPPIENVTDISPSFLEIVGVLYQVLWPWSPTKTAWTGRLVPSVVALETNVRLLSFSPADAKRFSDICRSHGATVSSTLVELTVCVISRLVADDPARYKTLSINIPTSLRTVARCGDDEICNYTSSYQPFPRAQSAFAWARATELAGELKVQKVKTRERLGFIRWIGGNLLGFHKGYLGAKRPHGINISNLGRFAALKEGRWSIGQMFFNSCDSLAGPAMALGVVGDPSGALNIGVTWGEKNLDEGFVEAFISTFQEAFQGLLVETL
ncbi:alcohol acetyltransferase-domain-containing protein [Mycena polygramma]|nr:alcohol acetyltransferase-domain-containing protein [Mycena polygramma]